VWHAARTAAYATATAALATKRRFRSEKGAPRVAQIARDGADAAKRNAAERETHRFLVAVMTEKAEEQAVSGDAAARDLLARSAGEEPTGDFDTQERWEALAAAWNEVEPTNAIDVATRAGNAASDAEQKWQTERLRTLLADVYVG
jgi:hypothetical protein